MTIEIMPATTNTATSEVVHTDGAYIRMDRVSPPKSNFQQCFSPSTLANILASVGIALATC